MDPGLHVKQALNHLRKVIAYAPYVVEDGADGPEATVALTPEDWGVVSDALFHMDTPPELLPPEIAEFGLAAEGRAIRLSLIDGTTVFVEAG